MLTTEVARGLARISLEHSLHGRGRAFDVRCVEPAEN
jgi:hypothetical protein